MTIDLYSELSRCNSLADQFPIGLVQSERGKCETKLSSLKRKIRAARILLDVLETEAAKVERDLELWTTSLAPIRQLPPEILSQIFVFSCLGDAYNIPSSSLRRRKYPCDSTISKSTHPGLPTSHALVQVCKHWRDIATALPQIWDHWVIAESAFDLEVSPPGILQLYNQGSARLQYPLAHFPHPLPYTEQCRALRVMALGNGLFGSPEMPLLEDLFLYDELGSSKENSIGICAPRLNKLLVYSQSDILKRFSLPWKQITYLSYGPPSSANSCCGEIATNFLQFLAELPNLTYLHLTGIMPLGNTGHHDNLQLNRFVTLPRLRTLEIHDMFLTFLGSQGMPILNYIRTPALEKFDLLVGGATMTGIDRFRCAIQRLTPFLELASQLRKVRVILGDCTCMYLKALQQSAEEYPPNAILKFSGSAQFFGELGPRISLNSWASTADFVQEHVEVVEPPFSNTTWPKDIVSLDCYIRRFIERGDLCFERPEFRGQGIALSYLPLGAYKRTIAKVVCEELLAECIVYDTRELYLMF